MVTVPREPQVFFTPWGGPTYSGAYARMTPYLVASNAPKGIRMAARRIRETMRPKWVSLYGDYIRICDGTNDEVDIDAAAALDAGLTEVSAGTFTLGASVNARSNTWFRGAGMGNTIWKGKAALALPLVDLTGAGAAVSNLWFEDIKFDGNSANRVGTTQMGLIQGTTYALTNFRLLRCWLYDSTGPGLRHGHANSTDIWIDDNRFTDFTATNPATLEPIVLGCKRFHINRNTFDNWDADNAISLNNSSGPTIASEGEICGNIFKDMGSTAGYCVDLWVGTSVYTLRVVIANNIGINVHNGFVVRSAAGITSGKVEIGPNYMSGTSQATSGAGVRVDAGATFPVVINGGVYDSFDVGLDLTGADCEANGVIVENTWETGVALVGDRSRLIGGRVRNSRRRNAGTANNVTVTGDNCEVRGVHISDTGTAQSVYGLDITAAADGTIYTDNTFTNAGATANIRDLGTNSVFYHNTGWVTENSGASTGTGAQQTIAHGLKFTPTAQQIALTGGSATAIPFHSAAPDATNIYVTAANVQAWYWATVGK